MDILDHIVGRVPGPGLYAMAAGVYHADPSPEPSLSSSIAKLLIEQSPAHAHAAHPRLGMPDEDAGDPSRAKEIGTVAHKLILGRGAEVVVIDSDDYRKGDAREARKAAYLEGHAPILRADMVTAERLAKYADARLAAVKGCEGFDAAPAEVVGIARHPSGAWLRIMMDRVEIHERHAIIWDVKTGEQSAAPHTLARRILGMGMEVQAALYVGVLGLLLPHLAGRIRFRWVFLENEAPHGLTVAEASEPMLDLGRRRLALALHRWNAARTADRWPGYPTEIASPEPPDWAFTQQQDREDDPDCAGVNWSFDTSPFRPLDRGVAA